MEFSQGLNYCQLGINICISAYYKCHLPLLPLLPTSFKSGIFCVFRQPGGEGGGGDRVGGELELLLPSIPQLSVLLSWNQKQKYFYYYKDNNKLEG